MLTFITILIAIVCVLLILVVLIQKPKGGGLASNFSGGSQIMGVKKTNDLVERMTWTLAIVLFVLSMAINIWIPRDEATEAGTTRSKLQEKIQDLPAVPAPAAQQPAAQQPASSTPAPADSSK
jgi:preprotein translocase subunit SecG